MKLARVDTGTELCVELLINNQNVILKSFWVQNQESIYGWKALYMLFPTISNLYVFGYV